MNMEQEEMEYVCKNRVKVSGPLESVKQFVFMLLSRRPEGFGNLIPRPNKTAEQYLKDKYTFYMKTSVVLNAGFVGEDAYEISYEMPCREPGWVWYVSSLWKDLTFDSRSWEPTLNRAAVEIIQDNKLIKRTLTVDDTKEEYSAFVTEYWHRNAEISVFVQGLGKSEAC